MPSCPKTIVELLEHHVRTAPERVAVVDGDESLTFAQLWSSAAAVAGALHAEGVRAGDCVGLYVASSRSLVVAAWGTLLAGAAYLPLAADYPAERLRYMIDDARLAHVATESAMDAALRTIAPAHVHAHHVDHIDSARDMDVPGPGASDPAYVIYTSGSTGRPKGVVVGHEALLAQLDWLTDELWMAGARILLKTPASFDAAQWELLANAAGATVVGGPAGVHREPARILDLVRAHGVTHLQCVPTLWTALLREPDLETVTSLRYCCSGGEALPTTTGRGLAIAFPGATLVNLYGPTEATINATFRLVTDDDLSSDERIVGIGRAVPGCTLHVLDQGRPVAAGELGELCIGGVQLALGYLHRPGLTAERFVQVDLDGGVERIYRTGDLVRSDGRGNLEFCGRSDDQVKVNGHRVETDEVRLAIEDHDWVRGAAVVPWTDPRDGTDRLAAFVELDPEQAALMDSDRAGGHHRSKADHTQVKAQLAGLATRDLPADAGVLLPNRSGRSAQRRAAFARKTYRFYEGDPLDAERLGTFLAAADGNPPAPARAATTELNIRELADVLRGLGPFRSPDRLLPKYAYASPGALNATHVYVETTGIAAGDGAGGLAAGMYYYHPHRHSLTRVGDASAGLGTDVRLHLAGLPRVIETVYATNVVEVLHFEAGHMLGVLDQAAGVHGRWLRTAPRPDEGTQLGLDESFVLSVSVDLVAGRAPDGGGPDVRVDLQVHAAIGDLRRGMYRWDGHGLTRIGDEIVERRRVIAINQETYDRSSFAVVLSCPRAAGWAGFVDLGRVLQRLQMNTELVGLMSSGYASLTGRDLPSATRYNEIVGEDVLSYLAVGGPVSAEQVRSTAMKEDAVHMRGPEEILRDDLRRVLPYYMVPAHMRVVERIPISSSGKCDRAKLIAEMESVTTAVAPIEPPAGELEVDVLRIWRQVTGFDTQSVADDFFACGGNSLGAVQLVAQLNAQLGARLPVQVIFERPTVRQLAVALRASVGPVSRLVPLAGAGSRGGGSPVFVWPGLGGYPMNLRTLAHGLGDDRAVTGVQAHGLNAGELPYPTWSEMVAADVELVAGAAAGGGPVTLAGYSFGARLAAEVALGLQERGVEVEQLLLVAPGSPLIAGRAADPVPADGNPYAGAYFRQVAYSVFAGRLPDWRAVDRLRHVRDAETFLQVVADDTAFDPELARRVLRIVEVTFGFTRGPAADLSPLLHRTQVCVAVGDGPSFVATYERDLEVRGAYHRLATDHYRALREPSTRLIADTLSKRQRAMS